MILSSGWYRRVIMTFRLLFVDNAQICFSSWIMASTPSRLMLSLYTVVSIQVAIWYARLDSVLSRSGIGLRRSIMRSMVSRTGLSRASPFKL